MTLIGLMNTDRTAVLSWVLSAVICVISAISGEILILQRIASVISG